MPILLTVKLIPRSGDFKTPTANQILKYHNTSEKILHTISENTSIEFIGLLECKVDEGEYLLSLAIVRSFPGHDTKETIKPFLDYLDNDRRNIQMVTRQATYSVRLASRVRLWTWGNRTDERLLFRDLESTVQRYTIIFATSDLNRVYDQELQILSPLLHCIQIRLNDTEFEETDGQLTKLPTPRKIILFHCTSPSTVQVCADQYMKKSDTNIGMRVSHSKFYLHVLLMIRC